MTQPTRRTGAGGGRARVDPAARRPLTAPQPPADGRERLQKVMAQAGVASRRASEDLIADGRVTVNGQRVTTPGTTVDPARDKITVDGKAVIIAPASRPAYDYIMVNKPVGYVSTVSDPDGRPTVLELVRQKGYNVGAGSAAEGDAGKRRRMYPVGRLDLESEGLLLLTDDGSLANALTHPRYEVPKEYLALVSGRPSRAEIENLRVGVTINIEVAEGEYEEYRTAPAAVELLAAGEERDLDMELSQEDEDAWRERTGNRRGPGPEMGLLRVSITEGKKRQVRLMCDAIGHRVRRLRRTAFGPLKIGNLAVGDSRRLRPLEIAALRRAVGLQTQADTPKVRPAADAVAKARAAAQKSFVAGQHPQEGGRGGRRRPDRPRG